MRNLFTLTVNEFLFQVLLHALDRRHDVELLEKEDHKHRQLVALEFHSDDVEPDANRVEEFEAFWLNVEYVVDEAGVYHCEPIAEDDVT